MSSKKAKEPVDTFFDVAKLREHLEQSYIEETEGRQRRINMIKREVGMRLKDGLSVSITQEMVDLKIDQEIWAMIMKAEFALKMSDMSRDEDDDGPRRRTPVSF